jgi:hypothetical protein
MDPKLVIGFIFSHYVLIFGTTLALFFTVSMLLLIRSIGQKNGDVVPIDVDALEGVMKRVLSTQPISIASTPVRIAPAPNSTEEFPIDIVGEGDGVSSEILAERDTKIESLKQEIDALKAATSQSEGREAMDSSPYVSEIADLNIKVDELQARLAEYEIIEDDIADLSMFKEKNRTLEAEVAELKVKLTTAAAEATEAAELNVIAAAVAEPAPSLTPSLDSGVKFEKIDKFELDLNDEAMKAFTQAVEGNSSAIAEVKNLPQQHAAPISVPVTVEVTTADIGSQADIDALFKTHAGGSVTTPTLAVPVQPVLPVLPVVPEAATPVASVDPQSEIDALMKAHAAAPISAPEPVVVKPMQNEPGLDDLLMGEALLSSEEILQTASSPSPPTPSSYVIEDPLAGVTDAEKMLSEVEMIADNSAASDADALEETLDTDKLLAEVDSLKAGIKSA